MKKYLKYVFLLLIAAIVGASFYGWKYYNYNYVEQVRNYYLISIDMPRVVKGAFRDRVQEGSIRIDNIQRYRNDSIAVAVEKRRSEEFDAHLMQKIRECSDDFKGRAEAEVYAELLGQATILMRISHIRKFDKSQLKKVKDIIIKNGVFSDEVRQYIENNKIDVEFYRIKD